jgi:hypothetical protein
MLNALIQLVTLLNGLMFNFLAPAVYGMGAYGEFIALNAWVFLVHKSMTIISEPLIRFTTDVTLIYGALSINGCVFLVFLLIQQWVPIGSPLLLGGMLLSASVMLALQALRLRRAYIALVLSSCGVFVGLLVWSHVSAIALPLVRVMELSVLPLACIWPAKKQPATRRRVAGGACTIAAQHTASAVYHRDDEPVHQRATCHAGKPLGAL